MANNHGKKSKKSKQSPQSSSTYLNDAHSVQAVLELFNYECAMARGPTYHLPYQVKLLRERIEEPYKAANRLVEHHEKIAKFGDEVRKLEAEEAARPKIISEKRKQQIIKLYQKDDILPLALGVLTDDNRKLKAWAKRDRSAASLTLAAIEVLEERLDGIRAYVGDAQFRLSRVCKELRIKPARKGIKRAGVNHA